MNYTKKELSIPYEKGDLYGVLFTPEKEGRLPAVILSHGFYSSYEATSESAKELAQQGYLAYCFDYHGCSYTNKSGGDLFHCSVLTEKEELSAVLDYIRSMEIVDCDRVYLLGQSMGSAVAALTGGERRKEIAGMILMYFPVYVKEVIQQMYPTEDVIPEVTENFLGMSFLKLGKKFFADILKINIPDAVSGFDKPVYLITGDQDKVVSVDMVKAGQNYFSNNRLEIVEGAEHGFHLNAEQAQRIIGFLEHNQG